MLLNTQEEYDYLRMIKRMYVINLTVFVRSFREQDSNRAMTHTHTQLLCSGKFEVFATRPEMLNVILIFFPSFVNDNTCHNGHL